MDALNFILTTYKLSPNAMGKLPQCLICECGSIFPDDLALYALRPERTDPEFCIHTLHCVKRGNVLIGAAAGGSAAALEVAVGGGAVLSLSVRSLVC